MRERPDERRVVGVNIGALDWVWLEEVAHSKLLLSELTCYLGLLQRAHTGQARRSAEVESINGRIDDAAAHHRRAALLAMLAKGARLLLLVHVLG